VKTLVLTVAVLCVAVATFSTNARAMSADELINKHVEATGGLEKHKSVKSTKLTGKMLMMGMELPFTVVQLRPNMMRVDGDFQGAKFVQAFDGTSGWMINPMAGTQDAQDMPALEELGLKYEADIDGVLIDYAEKGFTAEYVGEDEVEGTPVHHLKVDTGGGVDFDMYFDTEHFLLIKQTTHLEMEENEFTTDTFFSDFQDVEGIIVPHSIESRQGEHGGSQTIMIESLEYNTDIKKDVFAKPVPVAAEG